MSEDIRYSGLILNDSGDYVGIEVSVNGNPYSILTNDTNNLRLIKCQVRIEE